jgi:hypothetical protein
MKIIFALVLMLPAISFAHVYSCNGEGFTIDINANPLSMKVVGNGFNSMVDNIKVTSAFDTTIVGNVKNPAATIKLVIKDSSYANPGDSFRSSAQVSSAAGVREFNNLTCVKGND